MHVGGFGRTVGRSGSWVSTYPPPQTLIPDLEQAPSPHKPAHRFFPCCLAATFFCGQFMPAQIVQISSEGLWGHPVPTVCVRFLGQTRPSKCQQTTVSPQSHFLTKVTNLSPFLLKCNPSAINIRGGYDMATCIRLPKNMVSTWTQYLHGVAYYCNLDFSLHAIVCTERPPRAICWSRSKFPSQETGGRVSSLVANQQTLSLTLSKESNFYRGHFVHFWCSMMADRYFYGKRTSIVYCSLVQNIKREPIKGNWCILYREQVWK